MSKSTSRSIETVIENVRLHLTSSENFEAALPGFLRLLGEQFNCEWAAYWKVDSRVGVLRLADLWKANTSFAESLEADSKKRVFSSGEGMTGKVWRFRKSLWSSDLCKDMMLPRSLKANDAGLVKGVWFPVFIEQLTFGVVELLSKNGLTEVEDLFRSLESMGGEIGEYIEHTQ